MRSLILHRTGPGTTVQDLGRSGFLAQGLSRGGAADPVALAEGAALLGQSPEFAALEIIASIEVEVTDPTWIALTGAPKQASRNGQPLNWNACHLLAPGERLRLGPATEGNYAYLHLAGGIATPPQVGGRGAHLTAGLGAPLTDGEELPIGPAPEPGLLARTLPEDDRFGGGEIRILAGPQTPLFPPDVLNRFLATRFTRTAWANRQGVKLGHEGEGFRPTGGLNLISEVIVPGDIQVTGDGTPYVLGPECQTIGGYPRIGTVAPQDLPRVMQATPGARLRFRLVTRDEALSSFHAVEHLHAAALTRLQEQDRTPYEILMAENLISGVAIDIFDSKDGS
ncbi:biotin-dependent carboxyltransferase family protein [Tropicimonas sp. TH_r6]|uniref:5-oxoprolinase subunit C family protein n=1 Tax=Tropicimonas sp. TH_r6 TaxID=3082085 RepID=UPI002952E870|nr:biotin-dependent carboxyltransferase family protein [Tropicimonas sp. TH_r6]MDV7144096.1 biotin-dependent carboxyltransferase family protein [Tropicimonas sp. TH_r6]